MPATTVGLREPGVTRSASDVWALTGRELQDKVRSDFIRGVPTAGIDCSFKRSALDFKNLLFCDTFLGLLKFTVSNALSVAKGISQSMMRKRAGFSNCDMRIGYARVSTDDQTLDLQRDALKQAKCRQIYEEHASGKNANRPELDACLKSLREGDTLVVWRLDRLGRSLADLIRLTNELQSRGTELESLTEKIETASPTGKLVFHVFGALSEFERNLIRERTMAGLKAARARGRKGGRPRKLQPKEIKTIRALLNTAEISVQEVAARFGISRSTLYRNKLA